MVFNNEMLTFSTAKDNTPEIVGIVFAFLILLGICLAVIIFVYRKKVREMWVHIFVIVTVKKAVAKYLKELVLKWLFSRIVKSSFCSDVSVWSSKYYFFTADFLSMKFAAVFISEAFFFQTIYDLLIKIVKKKIKK